MPDSPEQQSLDTEWVRDQTEQFWEEQIIDSLCDYIAIPNLSPTFDEQWDSHGFMHQAVDHVKHWIEKQRIPGLELTIHEISGKTPALVAELPGQLDDTILIYGHLDKQPEFPGWLEGLSPWKPVLRGNKLYGRGGADDGYAIYTAICAVKTLLQLKRPLPRIVILIECSEESGSPDLLAYMDALEEVIGNPSLVFALDSTCGNYEQLWVTTSLRGMITGELNVSVLNQAAHSGAAGGIIPSSFRILRQVISRLEEEATGLIKPDFLQDQIPAHRRQQAELAGAVLKDNFSHLFDHIAEPLSTDPTELVLNNTWIAALEVTGMDGLPEVKKAGNVLRAYTKAKLALRLPPTIDATVALGKLCKLLESEAPNAASISFNCDSPCPGWHAPAEHPALTVALQQASNSFFGLPAMSMGCGGSIPFMEALATRLPDAQYVVTGVLGPMSNAHGPNEFLHIPTAKKITACVVSVICAWAER
jgi:acetylornithine deacetylase/succinyl-diaminopimelate desuccinylase-like protein